MSDWGQGAKNNNIGWGQGAVNNNISWGSVHADSWAGDTDIVGGIPYDADYQAILDYATTNNYTLPSDEQKLLQNQLLIDLKAAGVWDKLDTFANFATDGSAQFALIDWKRLVQYNASTGPIFTPDKGFAGNGTSSFVNANFNPSTSVTNYTLNNASFYIYLETQLAGGALAGSQGGDNRMTTGSSGTNNRINGGALDASFTFNGVGMKSIHRTSSLNVTLFNGTTSDTRIATANTSLPVTSFALRYSNTYGTSRVSMFAMGSSLITENADFVNAYNTYINSL